MLWIGRATLSCRIGELFVSKRFEILKKEDLAFFCTSTFLLGVLGNKLLLVGISSSLSSIILRASVVRFILFSFNFDFFN